MVKFSTVELPIPSPSSHFLQCLGSSTPALRQNERGDVDLERTRWTDIEEAILIHLMAKEVNNGNKKNSTFSKSAWMNIEKGFYEKTGKKNIISQLRKKFSRLKTRHSVFNKLIKEPGFKWDPVLDHVTASDDVWDTYIKENKSAGMFRKKGCPLFNELEIIYGNSVSESQNATQSIHCSPDNEFKSSQSDPSKDIRAPQPYATNQDVCCLNQLPVVLPVQGVKDTTTTTTTPQTMTELVQPSKNPLTELPKASVSSQDEVVKPFSSDFSITSCVKCLESSHGIDSATYLKAIKMFKDVEWREMFIAMSAKRRRDWLASL